MMECINKNLKAPSHNKIDGLAAVPPAMVGKWTDKSPCGEGCSSTQNNLCYKLTNEEGKSVNIAVVERCGGYCTCKSHPIRSKFGMDLDCPTVCKNSQNTIRPWCPGVGDITTGKDKVEFSPDTPAQEGNYAKATTCCGSTTLFGDNCKRPRETDPDIARFEHVDWCASSNHVHFDLDYDTANKLFGNRVNSRGTLTSVEPYPCDGTSFPQYS